MLKVNNSIQVFDVKYDAPRLLDISNSHLADVSNPWVEFTIDNHTYRVKAKDIIDAVTNSINIGDVL